MKRAFDLFFATVGLLVLSPVLMLIAVLVKVSDGGPVFFRQERVGRNGKRFWILKFRSMVVNAQSVGPSLTKDGDPRITGMGRLLRKTKLDELPQLWNVFVGEMSFVGPRPEVHRYVKCYTESQRQVLRLKPGITDIATLEFRNEEELLKRVAEGTRDCRRETTESRPRTADCRLQESNGQESRVSGRQPDAVERFYIDYCIPRKIELNLSYAARANVWQDTKVILRTLFPHKEQGKQVLTEGKEAHEV